MFSASDAIERAPDGELLWLETRTHALGVCPVVRFQNTMELADECAARSSR